MHNREHDVTAAMEAGVHGYLLQGCSIEELAMGVRLALGQCSKSIARQLAIIVGP